MPVKFTVEPKKPGDILQARMIAQGMKKPVLLLPYNITLDPSDPCRFDIDSTNCSRLLCHKCELCALFDKDGQPLQKSYPRYAPKPNNAYTMCIQLFIFKGDCVLLEKRAQCVVASAGSGSMVTGMVQEGEMPDDTVVREAYEELGAKLTNLLLI